MHATKSYEIFAFGHPGTADEVYQLVEIDAVGNEQVLIEDGPAFSYYADEYEKLTGESLDSAHRQYFREEDIQVSVSEYKERLAEVMTETGLDVVVSRKWEGGTAGRIIGFRLSLDSDEGQHGYDEHFGDW